MLSLLPTGTPAGSSSVPGSGEQGGQEEEEEEEAASRRSGWVDSLGAESGVSGGCSGEPAGGAAGTVGCVGVKGNAE